MTEKSCSHFTFSQIVIKQGGVLQFFGRDLVERWLLLWVARNFVCRNGGELNVTTL